ncbi:hypothetical protein AGDE_15954 [Angomonas deanei]|nr:hypothetical protein AGDE_15954 [Angomonas deanei]|eukprot:EPY18078.1 hypothetical protein AGDE_15954 [Angomonas deanei]
MGAMNPYGSMMNLNMNMGQPQNNMMPNMFMQNQMMSGGGMTLNSRGGMMTKQSMPMMGAMNMQQMQPQMMMKRQGQVETDLVEEGQVAALGRKSSQASLQRTPSRVGMYFKNKSAEGKEEEYKMEGDESIASKNRTRDPTLEHPFKSLFLYEEGNSNMRNNKHHFNKSDKNYTENDIELDGRTVRAQKPEDEEVTKYDYSGIALVSQSDDVEVTHEVLEEIRDVFAYGCNASLIMADADCPAAKPTSWFSWYALKTMAVSLFSRFEDAIADKRAEITMSMVLLQDDQSLDLLSDANVEAFQQAQNGGECNYDWKDIVVGESPLFGNVVQDLVYMWLDNAGDFNDTLDNALAVAEHYNTQGMQEDQYLNESEEYGIVLCTVLLKQIKTNSSGDQDIVFSSLFCSGVGNGVVHYNRILDKNPAEPRAVFYSVLHRSVHSCAAFSCSKNNAEIFTFLNTLQRFAKMETRKPKIGSVVNFIAYAESTIPRMEDELKKCEDPRRRAMTTKFLLRLRLMLSDFKAAIENPQEAVARTYL